MAFERDPYWRSKKECDALKKLGGHREFPVNCRYSELDATTCPLFARGCTQVPSQGRFFGKDEADVFFVLNGVANDDVVCKFPAIGEAGRYWRSRLIDPLVRSLPRTSYLVVPLMRCALTRTASAREQRLCASHFERELRQHKPRLLVAGGVGVFEVLYGLALNKADLPARDQQTLIDLTGNFYEFEFEGHRTTVYVGLNPSTVMDSPALDQYVTFDLRNVAARLAPERYGERVVRQPVTVERITLLKTAREALDYLDFLASGFSEPTAIAFDTETFNLNRKFGNSFLTWQFCADDGCAVVLPIQHPEMPLFEDPALKRQLAARAQHLFDRTPQETNITWWIAHNASFDLSVLYGLLGVVPRRVGHTPWWDTMLALHFLDERRRSRKAFKQSYGLKSVGYEMFGFKFEEEALDKRADGALQALPIEQLATYGGSDVILTRAVYDEQHRMADQQDREIMKRASERGRSLRPETRDKLTRMMRHHFNFAVKTVAVLQCNGLYTNRQNVEFLQSEDSPIWGRLDVLEQALQDCPEVRLFRERYRDRIGGAKDGGIEYDENPWFDNGGDALPKLDLTKEEHKNLFYLDFLGLTPKGFTDGGKPSIDKHFLAHYADPKRYLESPVIKELFLEHYARLEGDHVGFVNGRRPNPIQLDLEYRELRTLGNTYSIGLHRRLLDPDGDSLDGRIRADYNLQGTETGRLSSSNPNLQNLPSGRSSHGKAIKNIFEAERGTVLIQADAKTAEVRWAANFARDPNLVRIFQDAHEILRRACESDAITDEEFKAAEVAADFHRRTAALMFGVPPEKVEKLMRHSAKTITFSLLFGSAASTLAESNGWTLEEAEAKLRAYFAAFPKLEAWLKDAREEVKRNGFVETLQGRRRRLDHYIATGRWKHVGDAERRAMNSPIQGQSSDAGMIAIFLLNEYILKNNLEARWLIENAVHDSVLLQVPRHDVTKALDVMKACFEDGMQDYLKQHWGVEMAVTIEWEFEIGIQYGNLQKWDGRTRTLKGLLDGIDQDAVTRWAAKPATDPKPPPALDLVRWAP